jgi:N-acetyl-anhydromuramoyl-L-alanine amidase
MIDQQTGRLTQAQWIPSPNCDARPPGITIDLLVIHNISLPPGEFGGSWINDLFQNNLDVTAHPYFAHLCGLRVSSHFLIRRDGGLIQYVSLHQRAWHAGLSNFQGRTQCNDFSIGIELEGTDNISFTSPQYDTLVALTQELMTYYPAITQDRIIGHSDIAPGRKTDPGPTLDWNHYRSALANH